MGKIGEEKMTYEYATTKEEREAISKALSKAEEFQEDHKAMRRAGGMALIVFQEMLRREMDAIDSNRHGD